MVTPQLSVLLPARDAAETVSETLVSLRRQTFSDFEIVFVDDGSADDTVERACEAFAADPRLRVIRPGSIGLIGALGCGLEACRATLVARMDADDIAHPERFARQLALLANEDVDLVSCLVECFPRDDVAQGYRRYEQWLNGLVKHDDIVREMFIESPLPHPSVCFRKSAVVAAGGYRDDGRPEDYDLWLRMRAEGARFAKVPEVLLRWRESPGRHSRTHPRYRQDAFLACKAHHLATGPLAARGRVVVWGAGTVGRRLGKFLRSEGIDIVAWVDIDPRKIGRDLHGAPIIAPAALGRHREELVIAVVGSHGARDLIRAQLARQGYQEGVNFLCAA